MSARRWFPRLGLSLATAVVLLTGAELVFRRLEGRLGLTPATIANLRAYQRGIVHGFAPRPYTVFRRVPGSSGVNSAGFLDGEWELERTAGVPRVLCLGGSTTEGGNTLGTLGSYPAFLREILQQRLGGPVQVMNAGVSGWCSAELLDAWFLELQDYRPDLVVIHEGVNDARPQMWPGFRRDYSHYRRPWRFPATGAFERALTGKSDLFLWLLSRRTRPTVGTATEFDPGGRSSFDPESRILPPETLLSFRRNLLSIGRSVRDLGGQVALLTMISDPRDEEEDVNRTVAYRVAIRENNRAMREIAAQEGWLLCDLESLEQDRREEWKSWFLDFVHVDPRGNARKAELLAELLLASGWPELARPAGAHERR